MFIAFLPAFEPALLCCFELLRRCCMPPLLLLAQFMFRLLDVKGKGYLDARTINFFFREVTAKLVGAGHDPVNAADVQDEIFDMVTPENPYQITLEELRRSKQGHTILFMLVDCNAFWQYDNVRAFYCGAWRCCVRAPHGCCAVPCVRDCSENP